MKDTYVVFDVETPNFANNRMSAIGLVVVENGELTTNFYSLVNPETHFDSFNIRLTGITPRMVRNQPTFPVLWQLLRPLMEKGILCAHNAGFDLGVLRDCLRDYQIHWTPSVDYVCTCRMGRRLLPQMENHRLNTLADHLNIPLQHHNALSDAKAAAELLRYYRSRTSLEPFVRRWSFSDIKIQNDEKD